MRRDYRLWAVVAILAGLQTAACTQKTEILSEIKPAKVERVQGTELSRLTLTPKAVERLDIKTGAVREERIGARKRLAAGEVIPRPAAAANDGSKVWVRVVMSPADLRSVAAGQPAQIASLGDITGGTTARPIASLNSAKELTALHYAVDQADGFTLGQRVRVEVAVSGAAMRSVVPTSSMLYDAKGKTWVYTNPEPMVFVRHAITVDHIDGDRVVLSDGPAPGTVVVTVGAAELLGTEYGRK
ncbi:MAG TPA: hypothetical protein VET45_16195 [Candidatus Binatia bacterium]|nr:hypothetical protein [Candidatus Binatia bacterium]